MASSAFWRALAERFQRLRNAAHPLHVRWSSSPNPGEVMRHAPRHEGPQRAGNWEIGPGRWAGQLREYAQCAARALFGQDADEYSWYEKLAKEVPALVRLEDGSDDQGDQPRPGWMGAIRDADSKLLQTWTIHDLCYVSARYCLKLEADAIARERAVAEKRLEPSVASLLSPEPTEVPQHIDGREAADARPGAATTAPIESEPVFATPRGPLRHRAAWLWREMRERNLPTCRSVHKATGVDSKTVAKILDGQPLQRGEDVLTRLTAGFSKHGRPITIRNVPEN